MSEFIKLMGKPTYFLFFCLALIASLSVLWPDQEEFRFQQLKSAEGFRELILNNNSSRTVSSTLWLGLERDEKADGLISSPAKLCESIFLDVKAPRLGPRKNKIHIAEFFDYRCPYCKRLTEILEDVQTQNPDITIVYREWPILSDESKFAARAALAAHHQDRYQDFHKAFMTGRLIPNNAYISWLVEKFDLDDERFRSDIGSEKLEHHLQRNNLLARSLGLSSVPSLIVGRTIVTGEISKKQLLKLIALETRSEDLHSC